MKKKRLFLIPLFAVILVAAFVVGFSINNDSIPSDSLGTTLEYNSMMCVSTTGDFEGKINPVGVYELVECSHNVLYGTGMNETRDYLGGGLGAGDAFDWIELGDAALAVGVPTLAKAEAYTAHAADGLSTTAGTYGPNAQPGNWTIYHEFTSTAVNQLTNISRLQNAGGDDLAGNTFALVNLSNGDKLNVTWDIWVV